MNLGERLSSLIAAPVGNNLANDEEDVLHVKERLSRLNLFDNATEPEPHGFITRKMDEGIKAFQKERGLKIDGLLFPGGETEKALVNAQKNSSSSPGKTRRCSELHIQLANKRLEYRSLQRRLTNVLKEQNDSLAALREAESNLRAVTGKGVLDTTLSAGTGPAAVVLSTITGASATLKINEAKEIRDKARERYESVQFIVKDLIEFQDGAAEDMERLRREISGTGC